MKPVMNMTDEDSEREACEAAQAGKLREYIASDPVKANATLYGIVTEVVYERHTRGRERARGHAGCAVSLWHVEPSCYDAHQDNVAAVRADLLEHADKPIKNLRGWLVSRLNAVIVDEHRRQRGERGAQQRPRLPLPQWLDTALDSDPWLVALAVEVLRWVGVPTTAGDGVWPLGAWAERRAAATGEAGCSELRVAADVERVLAAMSRRPEWFERYVERPLGKKQTSVAYAPVPGADFGTGISADLRLVPSDADVDARLVRTACEALEAIAVRVGAGAELRDAVLAVVSTVFDAGTGAEEMDGVPGGGDAAGERVLRMMADPATAERVVGVVTELLRN